MPNSLTSPSQSLLAPFQVLLQLFSTPSFLQFLVPVSKTCPKSQNPQVTSSYMIAKRCLLPLYPLLDLVLHEICINKYVNYAGARKHGKDLITNSRTAGKSLPDTSLPMSPGLSWLQWLGAFPTTNLPPAAAAAKANLPKPRSLLRLGHGLSHPKWQIHIIHTIPTIPTIPTKHH